MNNKKILIFEDDLNWINAYQQALGQAGFEVHFCREIIDPQEPQFLRLLEQADAFSAIVWDGSMMHGRSSMSTFHGFIQAFKKVYSGHMIANSALQEFRTRQIEAGCTHQVSGKSHPKELIELLARILA